MSGRQRPRPDALRGTRPHPKLLINKEFYVPEFEPCAMTKNDSPHPAHEFAAASPVDVGLPEPKEEQKTILKFVAKA